jgi:hypothetical protein
VFELYAFGPAEADAVAAAKPASDIVIAMEERGIRAAGVTTILIERECGGTDLSLPGTAAIPQRQIRVVAAAAAE